MEQITTIGLDIAKNDFQVPGLTRLALWLFAASSDAAKC